MVTKTFSTIKSELAENFPIINRDIFLILLIVNNSGICLNHKTSWNVFVFMLIDTHSHIQGPEFDEDREQVLNRAIDAGVEIICLIGTDLPDCQLAIDTANSNPGLLRVVAGIHPNEASKWDSISSDAISDVITSSPGVVIGVGETGLDYHYDFTSKDQQLVAFLGQIELAFKHDLPLVIHCREAYDETLDILEDHYQKRQISQKIQGVLHCWFGSPDHAERAVKLGFVLGIGGACTFKNATELHDVVKQFPLESFVLETDAPYMAPVPNRGKRNEPAFVPAIAARIAELKNISVSEVERVTTNTAMSLYNLIK